ncbi:MAG: lytic transglycosylase domain-containing protein, partial [Novosphingobium sp.]|nr:lytic transglycosylase domain-containing protein [Novosphingobium sp.]
MSSMLRMSVLAPLFISALAAPLPALAKDGSHWDQARAQLVSSSPTAMAYAVDRWEQLTASSRFDFQTYASFLLSYPGMPREDRLRGYAEAALERGYVEPSRLVAFFDKYPPLTNPARAQYAIALSAMRRPQAESIARSAWRGGQMSATSEATIDSLFGPRFSQDDNDARMDALLWAGDAGAAQRVINRVSSTRRATFMARLSAIQGTDPASQGIQPGNDAIRDIGYVYNMSQQARASRRPYAAASLLATRPRATVLPHDPTAWVAELLKVARMSGGSTVVRIAASIDDGFPPNTDISAMEYKLRDDYTSLMWLGGTTALWETRDARAAAPLFYRYGAAARTPQTRSKGFYWAGLAATQAGDRAGATRYFEMAAQYPVQFYGMLSLERLGRALPRLNKQPDAQPSSKERADFYALPITGAVREAARDAPWSTSIRFFREIADQAETETEHVLVAQLARDLGRRDLAVILGEKAQEHGFDDFYAIAFPTIPNPPGTDWTMVHAITRQESQFAQNAISHAGARGLMQLMPATAAFIGSDRSLRREKVDKLYDPKF